MDRRELLKSLGWGSVALSAGGAVSSVMPAWAEAALAQGTPPRAGTPRMMFSRASLANGIIPHEDGGGKNGTLVVTTDDPSTGFDSTKIAEIISKLTGG